MSDAGVAGSTQLVARIVTFAHHAVTFAGSGPSGPHGSAAHPADRARRADRHAGFHASAWVTFLVERVAPLRDTPLVVPQP